MYIQRQRANLLEVCKLQRNIGPTYLQTTKFRRITHSNDMRLNGNILEPKCYRRYMWLTTVRYEGVKVWNEVRDLLKYCTRKVDHFKAGLLRWEGVKCSCSNSCIMCVKRNVIYI